jgi:uncharacterized protein YuzE
MHESYLEVTFRHGTPFAAYYYLPREVGQKSCRTERVEPGLLVDYDDSGTAIGIEITAPSQVTLSALNNLLAKLRQPPMREAEFSPLRAA